MKSRILLLCLVFLIAQSAYSKVWVINNSGNTYVPSAITISVGDSVRFVISTNHDAREVSQTTYNSNGSTPLAGGFQTAFGGGLLLPAQLQAGVHYFVCTPHASLGMKGTITVQTCQTPAQPNDITGNSTVCSGVSVTYTVAAVSGADSYTWTLPNGWTGTSSTSSIIATAGVNGGMVSVLAKNTCGNSPNRTKAVTVNNVPAQPNAVVGNTSVCRNSQEQYSVSAVNGASSYIWTLPNGWTGSSVSTSIQATTGTAGGQITVKASNQCGSGIAAVKTVSIVSAPNQPGAITGNTSVCAGSQGTYTIAAVNGASSYVWQLPVGSTGNSNSNTIAVVFGNTSGNISVKAVNACGESVAQTKLVTIGPAVAAPGVIAGNTSPCENGSVSYTINAVNGAKSYTWTLPNGWTGSSSTTSIVANVGTNGGIVSVVANFDCGTSTSSTLAVVASKKPAQPSVIQGDVEPCLGASVEYSIGAVASALSYNWTAPIGWTTTSNQNKLNVVVSTTNAGQIKVSAENECGLSQERVLSVNVATIPLAVNNINGPRLVCARSINMFEAELVTGTTDYMWTLPNGWTGSSNNSQIQVKAAKNSGEISVRTQNKCGVSPVKTISVAVSQVDTSISVTGIVLTAGANVGTYQWYNCTTKKIIGNQNSKTFSPTEAGNYAVILTQNNCVDTSRCITVIIGAIEKLGNSSLIKAYPNPVQTQLSLSIASSMLNKELVFIDVLGREMTKTILNKEAMQVDMSLLPDGLYFLNIEGVNYGRVLKLE